MQASPFTRARRALMAGVFFLAAGALWACDGGSVTDPPALRGESSIAGDTVPGDTTPIPPDTVPGDTVPPDTTPVPPDTVPGDTTPVPPDTVPGDTTSNPNGPKTAVLQVYVSAQAQDTAAMMGVGPAVFSVSRGSNVVAVDSTTSWGFGSLQLSPGRYTVKLLAYPPTYQLAPGESGEESVVLTPNSQTGVSFELARRP
jgi:hypothetical protein